MDENIENEIKNIENEIKNIKISYIKKNDFEYIKIKEQTSKNTEDLIEMKTTVKNTNMLLEKNNTLTESLNISNIRLTTILENITDKVNNTGQDVKELTSKINKIDIETSKNTDNRLSIKQVIISLVISILMLFIGAGLAQSGIK